MENAPLTPAEPESIADKDDKKSKKRAGELGSFLFASQEEAPKPKEDEAERSWFSLSADKAETKPAEKPEQPAAAEKAEADPAQVLEDRIEAKAAETEPAPEAEAPLEELGEAEKPVVEQQLVEAARELEVDQPADPAVERFRDLVVEEGKDADAAYEQVMEELDSQPETTPEAEAEMSDAEAPPDDEVTIDLAAETPAPEAVEEEPEDAAATNPPPAAAPPAGRGGTGGGRASGAAPPVGPIPPFGGGAGGPGGPGSFNPNAQPPLPAAAPNQPPTIQERIDDRASPAAMFLFGGIVGYLVGRRRGRIKTERKLLPVQKKLEKQVEDLQWQIRDKEARIRRAAAEKTRQVGPAAVEAIAAKRLAAAETQPEPLQADKTAELISDSRRRAPEARQLHAPEKAPERLGKMLMSAEAVEKSEVNKLSNLETKADQISTERQIETMNRTELLSLSEKIIVEGSSLRQIYENHLVGERGLRRLIVEHLRGGDLKRALQREIVEREIDFERDPVMRDLAPPTAGGSAASGGATLNQLVEKAAANISGNSDQAAFYKARDAYQSEQQQKASNQKLIDISLITTIVGLTATIIYLLIRG